MAVNYSVYNALRVRPQFDKQAAVAQQNMSYLSELNRMTERQNQQRLQAEQAISKSLTEFDQTEGLERDKQALLERIKKEEERIIMGIRNSGGDANRYINSGGLTDLRKYYTNIKTSEELNTTLNNRKINKDYQDAINQGKLAVPIVEQDENGQNRLVTFQQQLDEYEAGQREKLQWQGAERPIPLDPSMFSRIPNPRNPLSPGFVSVDELQNFYMLKGQNPLLANIQAEKSRVGNSEYTQYQYGIDKNALAMQRAKQNGLKAILQNQNALKHYQAQYLQGEQARDDQDAFYYTIDPGSKAEVTNEAILDPNKRYERITEKMSNIQFTDKAMYKNFMELYNYDQKEKRMDLGDWQKKNLPAFMKNNDGSLRQIDLNNKDIKFLDVEADPSFVQILREENFPGQFTGEAKDRRGYLKVRVNVPDNILEDMGLATSFGIGEDVLDEAQTNIDQLDGDRYRFEMYMPVPDQSVLQNIFSKTVKPDITSQEYAQMQMQNMFLKNPYMADYGQGFFDNFLNLDESDIFTYNQSQFINP